MKRGKELKVQKFKNYNVVYGSINNRETKAIYINISAWAQPKINDSFNYNRVIRDIDKKIRQEIYNLLLDEIAGPFLHDKTIVDFDLRESGIKYGKRSFTNCEVTLFLKNEALIVSEELGYYVHDIIKTIIKKGFTDSRYFKFFRKKK